MAPPSAETRLNNRILAALYLSGSALGINDIVAKLGLPRSGKHDVERGLALLCREGLVRQSGRKQYSLGARHPLAEATVEMSQSGYSFATALSRQPGTKPSSGDKDSFIPPARRNTALHGDRVLVAVSESGRRGKTEAEVLHILKRASDQLAGILGPGGRYGIVRPDDSRYPFDIFLAAPPTAPVSDGAAVIVRLRYDDAGIAPRGEIIEVLGDPNRLAVQVRLVIDKFNLPHRFSDQAEQEAHTPPPDPAENRREDLRDILHVTIDGADAKDFDDAVAVQKTRNGYRLLVSIADVGAFVPAGSRLDQEAYERGTSVYFPSIVVPMLPENLSNNLCSLLPDTDRLAVTAILDFNRQGGLIAKRFARSIMRSHQRFTYDTIEELVTIKNQAVRRRFKPFLTPLTWAAELARLLQAVRNERGSIAFSLPEAKILLDEDGQVDAIKRTERYFSHQIVEEFMLAANEAVAQAFVERGTALLFRIHEQPSPDKIADFLIFSKTLGLALPSKPATPDWYNHFIEQVKGTPHEYIVNNLLLRTMQQARYSPDNVGHFGLASEHYTHFTSPIRRYPDLIVHRLLSGLLDNLPSSKRKGLVRTSPANSLPEDGRHLSERERNAVSAERDMIDRLKRIFMARHLGEVFPAVVSGVTDTAFFVELLDFSVDGSVSLSTLTDDYYLLDEKRHRLIGDVSGRTVQIGDLVRVVLLDVDFRQNRINFGLEYTK